MVQVAYPTTGKTLEGKLPKIDSKHPATTVISLQHHEIHDGNHYFCEDYDSDVGIGNDNAKFWLMVAPSGSTRIHMFFKRK